MNLHKTILVITFPLTVLILLACYTGLSNPGIYFRESVDWQVQCTGQDIINLYIITPVLLISALLAAYGRKLATLALLGTMLYLVYTFTIYCFNVHFNLLFIIYCSILGLSVYGTIFLFYFIIKRPDFRIYTPNSIVKLTGIYFLFIAVAFALLWFSEVIPATVLGITPRSVRETGLFTNPVHIIDLSVLLPGVFITGILLLMRRPFGSVLAPALLTFFILMDITIIALTVIMQNKGIEVEPAGALITGTFALLSLVLLIIYSRSNRQASLHA